MAANNKDDDLDLAVEEESGSKKKLFMLIAAGLLLLLIAGGAIAWFLLSDSGDDNQESAETPEQVEQAPAIYHPLEPGFVVNLPAGSRAKLLQAEIQVVARDQATIDFVKRNDPMIRHNLLNLLGSHPDSELRSRQGKEKLQAEVLKQLNKIIKKQGGGGEIESVYFTAFVMQ